MHAIAFSILINGTPSAFFHFSVGLRQGCHLSLYLFIVYANALSHGLRLAIQSQAIDPYRSTPIAPSILHLLFADDCFLLSRASIRNAVAFR